TCQHPERSEQTNAQWEEWSRSDSPANRKRSRHKHDRAGVTGRESQSAEEGEDDRHGKKNEKECRFGRNFQIFAGMTRKIAEPFRKCGRDSSNEDLERGEDFCALRRQPAREIVSGNSLMKAAQRSHGGV